MYVRSLQKGEAISHVFEEVGIIYDMPLRVGEHLIATGKAEPATREQYLAQMERYSVANLAAAIDAEDAEPERKTAEPRRRATAETR